MKQKSARYELFRPLLELMHRQMVKNLGKKRVKTVFDTARLLIDHNPEEMFGSTDYLVLIEEAFWMRSGRNVLFPASKRFVDNLLGAKIQLEQLGELDFPFDSFVLAMPADYIYKGQRVRSVMVNSHLYGTENDRLSEPFLKEVGISGPYLKGSERVKEGEWCLVLCQNCDDGNVQRIMVSYGDIPKIMALNYPGAITEVSGKTTVTSMEQTPEELAEQFYALKLICALSVYNQATEGKYLRDGLPDNAPLKAVLAGQGNTKGQKHLTLGEIVSRAEGAEHGLHARSWHFRQLRDERYYRGEHATRPRGSRWVFVRDALIGEGQPSTIGDESQGSPGP